MSDFGILFGRPSGTPDLDDRFELGVLAAEELDVESYAVSLELIVNGDAERALRRLPRGRAERPGALDRGREHRGGLGARAGARSRALEARRACALLRRRDGARRSGTIRGPGRAHRLAVLHGRCRSACERGYTIVELNDGGWSTLPEQLDPRDLYRALLR